MTIGKSIQMKLQFGAAQNQNEMQKDANLLCGDAINNYKTVQSFGHEDLIVNQYEEALAPSHNFTIKTHLKAGIAFGFT